MFALHENRSLLAFINAILYCVKSTTPVSPIIKPGLDVIKLFSCSTQLSMKFFLLINIKMPIIVGILTFMSRKNSILGLSEPNKSRIS